DKSLSQEFYYSVNVFIGSSLLMIDSLHTIINHSLNAYICEYIYTFMHTLSLCYVHVFVYLHNDLFSFRVHFVYLSTYLFSCTHICKHSFIRLIIPVLFIVKTPGVLLFSASIIAENCLFP